MPDLLPQNQEKLIDQKIAGPTKTSATASTWRKRKKMSLLTKSLIGLLLAVVILGLSFASRLILSINTASDSSGQKISFFKQLGHLIVNPDKTIKGEAEDRINFLLMGIGGEKHDGPLLADTILLLSFKPSTSEMAIVSIPRDLLIEFPKYGFRKINNGIFFGEESKYTGGGEVYLSQMVSQTLGIPIQYYARLDFAGFKKIIDDAGGLDIYIDNSFSDYQYPDYQYGYKTIAFKKGWEHMNGERSLQFVRSRHGTNGEGSDFSRSKRQEKIILALKQKMLSFSNIITPTNIISVLDNLGVHSRTNLEVWEMIRLAKLAGNIKQNQVITKVLDNSPDGLLVSSTTPDGAYVLEPKDGDFSEVRELVDHIFDINRLAKENAKIEIQNGTSQEGLAKTIAQDLTSDSFNIVTVGNAQSLNYQKTTIYDLSAGRAPYTIASLKNKFKEAEITSTIPSFLTTASSINYENLTLTNIPQINKNTNQKAAEKIDILIIVGLDQAKTPQITSPTSFKRYSL